MDETEPGAFERMMAAAKKSGLNIEAYSRGQSLEESLAFEAIAQQYGFGSEKGKRRIDLINARFGG